MSEADRKRLDSVVLPRRLPGLALLERYFPSPADNQLDAELAAFARPGDTVLDPWAGTGWTARRAVARGMRVVAADPSPFAQLAAQAFLLSPEPAKLGIDRPAAADNAALPVLDAAADAEDDLPPAPVGLTGEPDPSDEAGGTLGEAGGPPPPPQAAVDPPTGSLRASRPRFASTVHPDPAPPAAIDIRQSLHYQQLRDRFPVLDGRAELVEELLDLYTPRNLYALQTIANKIETEFRDQPLTAVFRLALAACLLPGSRLNGYPGRVASLRIAGGHVRQPAARHQREGNGWRLFEAAVRDVRTAIAALGRDRRSARFAADLEELGGVGAANLLWIRCRPAVVGQYLPPAGIDFVLGSVPPAASVDEMSFEYLATAWLLGREAAETLRLEPLFGTM